MGIPKETRILNKFWKDVFKNEGVDHVYALPKEYYRMCCITLGGILHAEGNYHPGRQYRYQQLIDCYENHLESIRR